MASPMMSDSEAGIVDGFNGNEGMVMTMGLIFRIVSQRYLQYFRDCS